MQGSITTLQPFPALACSGPCTLEAVDTHGNISMLRAAWTMKPKALSSEEAEAQARKAGGAGVGEMGGS